MGEAAETLNDVEMALGVVGEVLEQGALIGGHFVDQTAHQVDALDLVVQMFGMLKWQIEEHPFQRPQRLVHAERDPTLGPVQRQSVMVEGAAVVAEEVARKLVDQQDQGESLQWIVRPRQQFAIQGPLAQRGEAVPDVSIGFGIRAKHRGL